MTDIRVASLRAEVAYVSDTISDARVSSASMEVLHKWAYTTAEPTVPDLGDHGILWMDGFHRYNVIGDLTTNSLWDAATGTVEAGTRFTSYGNQISLTTGEFLRYNDAVNLKSTGQDIVVGCAWRFDSPTGTGISLYQFYNTIGFEKARVTITLVDGASNRRIEIRVNDVVQATSSSQLPIYGWVYIEVKILISGNSSIEVNVDGSQWVTASGMFINDDVEYINVGGDLGGIQKISDFYLLRSGNPLNNDFLGPSRVMFIKPDGDSAVQFASSEGSNYLALDENISDGDTTNNYSDTLNQEDLFTTEDVPVPSVTVHGIQLTTVAKKDDSPVYQLTPKIKVDTDEQIGTEETLTLDTYNYYLNHFDTKDGTLPWDNAAVNDLLTGYKLTGV